MKLFLYLSGDWQDITYFVISSSLSIPENLISSELKPASNTVSFSMLKESPFYDDLLSSNSDIPFKILDDTGSIVLFTGFLTDDYAMAVKTSGKSPIELTAEDAINKRLKVEWSSVDGKSTRYKGVKVIDVVRSICMLSGIVFSEISYSKSDLEDLVYFSITDLEDDTYYEVITPLLLDFGYTYYINAYGEMALYQLDTSGASYITLDKTSELTVKKTRTKYDEVDIKWYSLKTLSNEIIFDDTTGSNSDSSCLIELKQDEWYPEGTTLDTNTYSNYKLNSGTKVVLADGVTSEIYADNAITQSFENYGTFAVIKLHNTADTTKKITRLRVHASTVIAQDSQNTTTSLSGGKRKYKYESKYINTKAQSERLAAVLFNYYNNLNYSYSVKSPQKIEVGSYVIVSELVMSGITQKCRITGRLKTERSNLYTYTLQAVDDFAIVETRSDLGTSVSATEPRFASLDQIRVIENGDESKIPDSISSVTVLAAKEGLTITWPWDGSGLANNIKRYRVEISDDSFVTWRTFYVTTNRCVYTFIRDDDGYPEASELALWRVRVKAENMYDKESDYYGPSAGGEPVNTSKYDTWIPSIPAISPYTSGRMAVISWDAGNQYGQYGYDVQICRKDSTPIESEWRRPDLSLDARASENNYTDGTSGALMVTVNQFSQSLPLTNQALNLPVDTVYYYRVRGVSLVPTSVNPSAVIVGDWSPAYAVLARPGGSVDLAGESIQKEQIAPSAVTIEKLNILAKNKVNPLTNAGLDNPFEGWTMSAGALTQETDSLVGYPVGKISATVARLYSDSFEIGPDEILEITFHARAPAAATSVEFCVGDASGSARRYETAIWGAGTKVWGAFSGVTEWSIVHNATTPVASSYLTMRTYIVGINVTPDMIPAPLNNIDSAIKCFRVKQATATISVVNRAGTGALYIFAPTALTVGAGVMTAGKIVVKDLSAISALLGEVKGGPSLADDDRIVIGGGYDDGTRYLTTDVGAGNETYDLGKKGTLKLGKADDEALFWRVYSVSKSVWRTIMRMSTFIVDAVASTIRGIFVVRTANGAYPAFRVNPTGVTNTDPIEIGADAANIGGDATSPVLKKTTAKSVPIMNPRIPYLSSGNRGYTGTIKGSSVSFEEGVGTENSGRFWDAGIGCGDATYGGQFAISRRGSTLIKVDSTGLQYFRIPTIGGGNFWQAGAKYDSLTTADRFAILRNSVECAAFFQDYVELITGGMKFTTGGTRKTGITKAGGAISVLDKTSGTIWALYVKGDRITLYNGTTEYQVPTTIDTFPKANLSNTATKLTGQSDAALLASMRIVCFEFSSTATEGTVYTALSAVISATVGENHASMGHFGTAWVSIVVRGSSTVINIHYSNQSIIKRFTSGSSTQIGQDFQVALIQYVNV